MQSRFRLQYVNLSSRPCANPRRDERGPPAETTELACGHTCRMPPVRGRRPSPMLPSLPLCAQAGQAPPRTSGRPSENRDTTGSAVSPLRSKPRIRRRNIDRTQCATNVLPDTGSRGSSLIHVSRAVSPSFGRPAKISVAPLWPCAMARFGTHRQSSLDLRQRTVSVAASLQGPAEA